MKLEIIWKLDGYLLNKDYRSTFYSFFKQILDEEDHEKYLELYGKKDAKVKSFCFSIKLDNPHFHSDDVMVSSDVVKMYIRSCDEIELYQFYNSFLQAYKSHKLFPMHMNQARIVGVKLLPLRPASAKTLYVKFLAPLVVKEHDIETNRTTYYTYEDEAFFDNLKSVSKNISEVLGYTLDFDGFEIIPVNPEKTVVSVYSIQIPVSMGSYILKGNEDLLNFLYNKGMGYLTSSGFGVFEILGKEQ